MYVDSAIMYPDGEIPLDDNGKPIKETPIGVIIDIQYTTPGYWIMKEAGTDTSEETELLILESNRTETEDGWFKVSYPDPTPTTNIKYRFKDGNRDVLECIVEYLDAGGGITGSLPCTLIRIPESRALAITT